MLVHKQMVYEAYEKFHVSVKMLFMIKAKQVDADQDKQTQTTDTNKLSRMGSKAQMWVRCEPNKESCFC